MDASRHLQSLAQRQSVVKDMLGQWLLNLRTKMTSDVDELATKGRDLGTLALDQPSAAVRGTAQLGAGALAAAQTAMQGPGPVEQSKEGEILARLAGLSSQFGENYARNMAPLERAGTAVENALPEFQRSRLAADEVRAKPGGAMADFLIGMVPIVAPTKLAGTKFSKLAESAVKNEEGLIPVFHGTPTVFKDFSTSRAREGLYGNRAGGYFTEEPKVTEGYSKLGKFEEQQQDRQILERDITEIDRKLVDPLVSELEKEHLRTDRAIHVSNMPGSEDKIKELELLIRQVESKRNRGIGIHKNYTVEDSLHSQRSLEETLAKMKAENSITPNVHPAYLDIKNPFDMQREYPDAQMGYTRSGVTVPEAPPDPVLTKLRGLIEKDPRDLDIDSFNEALERLDEDGIPLTGHELFRSLERVHDADGNVIGRNGAQELLEAAGFDGITHLGNIGKRGQRNGLPPHRVWIPFSPDQIHSSFDVLAETKKVAK